MRLYINNILVSTAWLYWDCAYNRDEQNYNIVPVSKGDVITFSGGKKSSSMNCFLFYTHNPI